MDWEKFVKDQLETQFVDPNLRSARTVSLLRLSDGRFTRIELGSSDTPTGMSLSKLREVLGKVLVEQQNESITSTDYFTGKDMTHELSDMLLDLNQELEIVPTLNPHGTSELSLIEIENFLESRLYPSKSIPGNFLVLRQDEELFYLTSDLDSIVIRPKDSISICDYGIIYVHSTDGKMECI